MFASKTHCHFSIILCRCWATHQMQWLNTIMWYYIYVQQKIGWITFLWIGEKNRLYDLKTPRLERDLNIKKICSTAFTYNTLLDYQIFVRMTCVLNFSSLPTSSTIVRCFFVSLSNCCSKNYSLECDKSMMYNWHIDIDTSFTVAYWSFILYSIKSKDYFFWG